MPNLGNDALNLILDLVTTFAPVILTVLAGWALWAYGWLKKKEANNATFATIDAAARQAVAAAEQAIASADKSGKFTYAAAVLHAQFPRLDEARTTAAIESAVAAIKQLPALDSVSATQTSPSVQPILTALGAPSTQAKLGADAEAILRAVRADMVTVKRDTAEAKARAAAAEAAIRTPTTAQTPAPSSAPAPPASPAPTITAAPVTKAPAVTPAPTAQP